MFLKNRIISMVFVMTLLGWNQSSIADCIQDQYGNKYTITYDAVHKSIKGTALMAQCSNETWPVNGSFVTIASDKTYRIQQISFERPINSTASCTGNIVFMLKGTYPNFDWYYSDSGYGGQTSKFIACTTAPSYLSTTATGKRLGAMQ